VRPSRNNGARVYPCNFPRIVNVYSRFYPFKGESPLKRHLSRTGSVPPVTANVARTTYTPRGSGSGSPARINTENVTTSRGLDFAAERTQGIVASPRCTLRREKEFLGAELVRLYILRIVGARNARGLERFLCVVPTVVCGFGTLRISNELALDNKIARVVALYVNLHDDDNDDCIEQI